MAKQSTPRKQGRSKRETQQQADTSAGQNGRDDSSYERELADYLQERIKPGLNRGAIPLLARSIAKEIAHRAPQEGERESNGDSAEAEDEYTEVDDIEETEAEGEEDFDDDGDEPDAEADDDFEEEEAEGEEDFDEEDSDEPDAEADDDFDEAAAEADDNSSDEADEDAANGEGSPDFEADMREVQAELGEDWILRFSVQGDDTWLTAEKEDGSQRVEAPTAAVLAEVVELLNENGGRSS
jgi:hypothetical protein